MDDCRERETAGGDRNRGKHNEGERNEVREKRGKEKKNVFLCAIYSPP